MGLQPLLATRARGRPPCKILLDSDSFINDNIAVYEIRHYLAPNEKDVYMEWRRQLCDTKARIAVDRRINRIELGNFGDHNFAGMGYGSCGSTSGQDIESITRSPEPRWFCCCVGATSERKTPTSTAPVNTGWTGKGGTRDEGQTTR